MENNKIYLPGLGKQVQVFIGENELADKEVLIMGANSASIAKIVHHSTNKKVHIIVEDYDSLMNINLELEGTSEISASLMDFEVTDFENNTFDLVYAQASISNARRNKIVKEIKRITKPEGVFCVGEIVKLEENVPTFVENIFESSDLNPHFIDQIDKYYEERKFEVGGIYNFSSTMKQFYSQSNDKLIEASRDLTDNEKSYYKKLLKQMSHESGAYLKQGADKYIGFLVLMLRLKK